MLIDLPAQAPSVYIVDVSNLSYTSYYGNKDLATSKGQKSGHVFAAIRTLIAQFDHLGQDTCPIFCYDGENAKKPRLEIYPEYKGNRTPHDFYPVPDVKEMCKLLPGLHIEYEYGEGDDAIVWAAMLNIPKPTFIFTGDEDLMSLKRIQTLNIYSPNKKRFVEKADWLAKYHVEDPAKIPISKALFGDKSDNIIGVERLIKKQVEPILNDSKCLDIETFYDMLQTQPESMSDKMYQKVMENKDRVMMNYKVVKPMISDFTKRAVTRTTKSTENRDKLFELLKKFECYSVLADAERLYL